MAAFLLLALLAVSGCTAAKPSTPAATNDGTAAAPSTEELTRLRTEYGEREDFSEICGDGPTFAREAQGLAEAGEWAKLATAAQVRIAACPVDLTARLVATKALLESGRKEEARVQMLWFDGLLDSILASGDGKTPQGAFVVISIAEEYATLGALRLQPTQQALVEGDIDAITARADDGSTHVLYFNPAAHFRRLRRELGEMADEPPVD